MQRADGGGHRSLFHEERRDAGRHCLPTGLPFLFSFRDAIISRRREKTKRKTKRPAAGTWQRAQRDGTRTWCGHERNDVDSRTRTNSREDKQSEKDTDTKDRQPSFQVFRRFILVPPRCFCRSLVSTSPLVPTIVVVERLQFHYVFPICSLFLFVFF